MAYQNVGTPIFYINVLEWLASTVTAIDPVYRTLPVIPTSFNQLGIATVPPATMSDNVFVAVLGHRLNSDGAYFILQNSTNENYIGFSNIVYWGASWYSVPEYDGFTIAKIDAAIDNNVKYIHQVDGLLGTSTAGSIIIGTYYDMPHSPDLKLTMTREMDGVKRIRTKGGADLVNHKYTKPPLWGDAAPWELYSGTPTNQALSRSGRRVWDLSFSYLQDSDVFPMLSSLNPYESVSDTGAVYSSATLGDDPTTDEVETDYVLTDETDWHDSNTLIDSNNFYSQVIHKTNGGQLPFIFQPDSNNNNPDQFAICKFDMKSFKFDQVANGVYNVKLKIREVW